jgi:hypothetical protein
LLYIVGSWVVGALTRAHGQHLATTFVAVSTHALKFVSFFTTPCKLCGEARRNVLQGGVG